MKVQGSAYPERIWIRNKELGYVYITLRDNVEEKQVEHDETTDAIYDALFEMWLQQEATPPLPTEEERLQAIEDAVLFLSLGGI